MKKSILITGVAGAGKSTLGKRLCEMGYVSYEIETIPDLFHTVDRGTNELFEDYDQHDPEKVKRAKWVCDIDRLRDIISNEAHELAFYCGICSNIEETFGLFDRVFVLSARPYITRERLTNRTSHDFGKSKEVQDWLLSWKDNWEKHMQERGVTIISSDKPTEDIAKEILDMLGTR